MRRIDPAERCRSDRENPGKAAFAFHSLFSISERKASPISNLRCNEQIRLTPIRLIDEEGGQRGVVATDEALRMAREAGLDLVEVQPTVRPPVCKIMDYGKHKYEISKKLKQKHHERKLKEVRMRPKTDPHDKDIKMRKARDFLVHGDRVQFTMMFRGRERFHQDMGLEIFNEIVQDLTEVAKVETPPEVEQNK